MTPPLTFVRPVTLVGGARVRPYDVEACLALAPHLVAADSGADRLLSLGLRPVSVIGDMDSLSAEGRAALEGHLHIVSEQDSTDFEKCLTRIAAPNVLAVGFDGGRVDHALSVLNVLARHPARRCVVVGAEDLTMLAPPRLLLPFSGGERVSLFPLRPVAGESTGLAWPIAGIPFAPDGRVGISNRAEGPVALRMDAPGMLLILPRGALPELLAALDEAPGWE